MTFPLPPRVARTRRCAGAFAALALLVSTALAPPAAAQAPRHVATTPVPQSDPDAKERFEKLNKLPGREQAQLVFLGDSITQLWDADDAGKPVWNQYWAPLKAVNLGVSGDRTEHVLWRIDHGNLDRMKPKAIVLLIGTNNTGQQAESDYRCTAQQTADGVRAILERLKAKCPSAKILLMGIFPRGEENENPLRQQNEATNTLIKRFADDKRVFYKDIGAKFMKPNGDLSVVNMPDILHLSTQGYHIWAEAIYPTVKKLMAP